MCNSCYFKDRKCLPSIVIHSRISKSNIRNKIQLTHDKKLCTLSPEQERPLFNVKNTVTLFQLDKTPPKYVLETLSLSPKISVLDKFEPEDILMELDCFLNHCVEKYMPDETITDINVKTLHYIKKCKKLESSRHIQLTKKYLKEENLLAIPFDKGIDICLMKKETYDNKMNTIITVPQFEKVVKKRKNTKHQFSKKRRK